jgi:hypothetical protein
MPFLGRAGTRHPLIASSVASAGNGFSGRVVRCKQDRRAAAHGPRSNACSCPTSPPIVTRLAWQIGPATGRGDGALRTDDRFNAAADGTGHLVVDHDLAVDATVALSIVATVGDFELSAGGSSERLFAATDQLSFDRRSTPTRMWLDTLVRAVWTRF